MAEFNLKSIPKRIHKTLSNLRTGVVLLILSWPGFSA